MTCVMVSMPQATALFADRHTAHAAVEQLVQAGFARDALSLVMSEETHEREFGAPSSGLRSTFRQARQCGVLATIVTGLASFAARGDGIAVRAAGPVVHALRRVGVRAGSLLAPAMVATGLGEVEARAADWGLRNGGIFVGVDASVDRVAMARALLELSGGAALQAA
jgi:hypothetical protein